MNAAVATARKILESTLVINTRTTLVTVRAALDGIDRKSQNAALIQAQRDGFLVLYRNDNTPSLTAADKAACVMVGDSPRHLVYRTA